MTVSVPIRIFALVGLLAAAGLAVWMLDLNRAHSSSSPSPATTAAATHASATHAAAAPATTTAAAAPTHPAAHAATPTKPAPVAKRAKPRVQLLAGLPAPVAKALRKRPVVVVALYARGGSDSSALSEARAGAAAAHAPFLAIDVLRSKANAPLAQLAGGLAEPATLVVRRPGKVVQRLDGHQDRQVVAQAVSDAR